MTELSDLVQGPGERHIVYGGTRTGKSSFTDWGMRHIQEARPSCMQLVADTKPRFRAETIAYGPGNRLRKSAEKAGIYRSWAHGPVLPNSVKVPFESDHPFRGMWNEEKNGPEIVIMQSSNPDDWRRMVWLMHHFADAEVIRERLVNIDEGLDFYQRNTLGIDSKQDPILHIARAGGERNVGLCLSAHRPHGIPPLLNTLSSRVSLFHLRFARDMHYLWEMGIPDQENGPEGDYVFHQYTVERGGAISEPTMVRLAYPDSYLKQLANT